jgi:hypothetical protein
LVELATLQAVSYIMGSIGVFVAAIYYVFNMRATLHVRQEANRTQRQQLETRQAQMFMGIYIQITTKEFTSAFWRIIDSNWSNYEEYRELSRDPEFRNAAMIVGTYYEGVGVLVREELLDIRWVALLICGMTRMFWEKIEPAIEEVRRAMGMPRWMSETEYLYDELMRYLEKHPELKT